MIPAACVAIGCMLAFALAYYSKTIFSGWFQQGHIDIGQKSFPGVPKIVATDRFTRTTVPEPQKGYGFEKFVVKKFPREYFVPITWRSDKYVDGIYPESNRDPDLVMEYRGLSRFRFAVECKWRSRFRNGFIQWAKDYQIDHYFEYQQRTHIPVFIIIGVGGSEEKPAELYILPLDAIKSNNVSMHADNLKRFRRPNPHKMFFFDTKSFTLR